MPELFNIVDFLSPINLLVAANIALLGLVYIYQSVTHRSKIRKLNEALAQERGNLQRELENIRILRSTKDYCVPIKETADE